MEGQAESRRRRFRIAVQRTRTSAYILSGVIGLVFVLVGVIQISPLELALLIGCALTSSLVLSWLVVHGRDALLGATFDWLWLIADAVFITWVVIWTGGAASPWFPWYLANIGAAAFVVGQRGAFVVFLADATAYLGALAAVGDIHGLDLSLYQPLARMVFLYGASFLFLRGVNMLAEKRQQLEKLRRSEAHTIDELTRLAAALDRRTRDLAEANLRTAEADRMKSRFLATMSHELRTPLNSIIGFSEILLGRLNDDDDPKERRFLGNIHSSGEHLLGIINDLLDLSKIEAGHMELHAEPVDVASVVHGVCAVAQGAARTSKVDLEIDIPADLPTLEADPIKLKQILFNLVANAVKFSPPSSTVTVRARSVTGSNQTDDLIRLEIEDHGTGIDARYHRAIFDEFRQIEDGPNRGTGGTGLGLALVKRLVELHNGQVGLVSEPGEGSTFSVALPLRFAGPAMSSSPSAGLELPSEGGLRVLVVEDDPTAYESLAAHLTDAGFVPIRARTSGEALCMARELRPAAITLDVILPDGDGLDTLRRLKHDPVTRDIPVVMVSVLDNRELALALGAADYMVKPVDGDRLIKRMLELIPRTAGAQRRLLLIDDDETLHELVTEGLGPLGYELFHAFNGQDGLSLARSRQCDLILLDLMMDGMDGFEVAARLKADSTTRDVPIVVLTAHHLSEDDRERLRHKIAALVGKLDPLPGGLATVIQGVLDGASHEVHHG